MRLPRTLWRSLLCEVAAWTALGFALLALLYLGRSLLGYLDEFLALGASGGDVLGVLACASLVMLGYALPVAFLFGVLVALGRMAADAELTALRACGVGLRGVLAPLLCAAALVACFAWTMSLQVEHRARRELRQTLVGMAARAVVARPVGFHRMGDRVLHVGGRAPGDALERVTLLDSSHPGRVLLVLAERGRTRFDPGAGRVILELEDGEIHVDPEGDGDRYRRIGFRTLTTAIGPGAAPLFERLLPKDMTMEELRAVIAHARSGGSLDHLLKKKLPYYELQVHRRYALPLAPVLFALTGVSLSVSSRRGSRSRGALACVALVGAYYAALMLGRSLALRGELPAVAAMWLPNAGFALIAALLLLRAGRPGR